MLDEINMRVNEDFLITNIKFISTEINEKLQKMGLTNKITGLEIIHEERESYIELNILLSEKTQIHFDNNKNRSYTYNTLSNLVLEKIQKEIIENPPPSYNECLQY